MVEMWTEWGVRTSNGTVHECSDEVAAQLLIAESRANGCQPKWQLVSRVHKVEQWS